MFERILNDPDLFSIVRQDCRENSIGVCLARELLDEGGNLQVDRVIILKLDAFYSSNRMHNPPPAPDYLVIVRCCDGSYEGYLIELRDTVQKGAVRASQIVRKFTTAVDDFFRLRYGELFYPNGEIVFRSLKMYLVTDPLGLRRQNLNEDGYRARIKGSVLDAYANLKPIVVGRIACLIEPILPDPTVTAC